ncbi:MAG: hypothetical protein JSV80_13185 [Acidobacteriota bacterium]|nr:MAG: hypothetical protein JSV80_13185 [Acidobacteriota bacterium]
MRLPSIALVAVCALACSPPSADLARDGLLKVEPTLPEKVVWDEPVEGAFSRVGPIFVSGQPSEEALRRLAREGVTVVVNVRTSEEMADRERVAFDEQALLAELGIDYEHIPLGGDEFPYTPEAVDAFAQALARHEHGALLHCASGRRVSHLWTAYLVRYHGLSLEDAMAHGEVINLGTFPLDGLLGGIEYSLKN